MPSYLLFDCGRFDDAVNLVCGMFFLETPKMSEVAPGSVILPKDVTPERKSDSTDRRDDVDLAAFSFHVIACYYKKQILSVNVSFQKSGDLLCEISRRSTGSQPEISSSSLS